MVGTAEFGRNTIPCKAFGAWLVFNKEQIYHALRLTKRMHAVSICFGLIEHNILNGGVDLRGRDFDDDDDDKDKHINNNNKRKQSFAQDSSDSDEQEEGEDEQHKSNSTSTKEFKKELLRIRWANLFRRALEYIFAVGFVFFQLTEDANGELFPEVVDLEDPGVVVEYRSNALQQFEFRIKRVEQNVMMLKYRADNKEITDDYEECIAWVYSRPDCFGVIQSEITRVVASLQKEQQVWQTFLIVARHHETHDVFVSKEDKDNGGSGGKGPPGAGKLLNQSLLRISSDAVIDPCADDNSDNYMQNEVSNVDSVNMLLSMMNTRIQNQRRHAVAGNDDNSLNSHSKDIKNEGRDSTSDDKKEELPDADSSGLPRASKVRYMGTNFKVVTDKPPGMPYDYREMSDFLMDAICDILRLPRMVWKSKDLFSKSSTSRQTNNGDQATQIYEQTIQQWARALQDMGKYVYYELKDRKTQRDLILLQHTLQKADMDPDEYEGVGPMLMASTAGTPFVSYNAWPADTSTGPTQTQTQTEKTSLVDSSYDDSDNNSDSDVEYRRRRRRRSRERRNWWLSEFDRRHHPYSRRRRHSSPRIVRASAFTDDDNTQTKNKDVDKDAQDKQNPSSSSSLSISNDSSSSSSLEDQFEKEQEKNKGTKRKQNKHDIDFVFPSLIKKEAVISMYNNGYMSLDVFQSYLSRSSGIPLDDLLEFKSGNALPAKVPYVMGSDVEAAGFHATTRAKLEEIEMKKKADEIKIQLQMKLAEHKLEIDRDKLKVDKERHSMDLQAAEQQMKLQKQQGEQQMQLDKQKAETTMSTMKEKAKLQQQSHSSSTPK